MTVHVYFNPEVVDQLAACGIARRRPPGAPARGFVLPRFTTPQGRADAVTHVVSVQTGVRITGYQQPSSRRAQLALPPATAAEPRTALEMIEECDRLRRDNQRLTDEVAQLRADVARLTGATSDPPAADLDGMSRRFALLELD